MTTQQLYQKTLNEQMSHGEFLSAVRKDPQYSNVLTNVMSFEDTINTLKSKGFIWDANKEANQVKSFDFLGSFKALNEAATKKQKLKGGKGDKLTPDQVNYFEFRKGWQCELEHTDDIDKAKEIALDHLAEDPMYYTRLEMIETKSKKKERSDLPIDISVKKASVKDDKNQMSPIDKKKEKPNVTDSGKKEKARSKSAGIKKMKGGLGQMTSLNEAIKDYDAFKKSQRDRLNIASILATPEKKKETPEEKRKREKEEEEKEIAVTKAVLGKKQNAPTTTSKKTSTDLEKFSDDDEGLEFDFLEPGKSIKGAIFSLIKISDNSTKEVEVKTIKQYKNILKLTSDQIVSGKKVPAVYKDMKPVNKAAENFLEYVEVESKGRALKKEPEETSTGASTYKDKSKKEDSKDNDYSIDVEIIKDGKTVGKTTIPAKTFEVKTGVNRLRVNTGTTYPVKQTQLKLGEKDLKYKVLSVKDTKGKKIEPYIDVEITQDGKNYGISSMPVRVFEKNTNKKYADVKIGDSYSFVIPPPTEGEKEKKVTYVVKSQKNAPFKQKSIISTTGVGGSDKDITGRTIYTAPPTSKEPTVTKKAISALGDSDWIAVDPNGEEGKKIVRVFEPGENRDSYKAKNPTHIITRYIDARRKKLLEEKQVSTKEMVKSVIGKPVSFTMPDAENPDEKSQVSNTVSNASFDPGSNKALFIMNDGAKLYFENIGAEPVGYYFSADEKGKIDKQDPKYKVLQVMSPLKEIIYKKENVEKQKDTPEEILENYIRIKVKKLLKEYDAGPYIGVSGPDVVKKKLEDYLKRYDANWETDPSPKQRSINMEYEDIISQLVDELNNKESGEGDKMVKKYTSKPMAKNAADRSTPPPSTLAYDPTKLVSRGGRVAEEKSKN